MLNACLQKVDKENIEHNGDFVHKVHGEGCSAELKELKMTLAVFSDGKSNYYGYKPSSKTTAEHEVFD
ncbi:hypothetical protein VspSTUT11_16460 [Vibrio sp. STUT-A11]|nr:hypothetical protein VspSTUT11_16460 [Vibrio sp. STUT-A11]